MSIAEMIRRGQYVGRASAGPWRVETNASGNRELWHYATRMLTWSPHNPADIAILDWSTGHGSVSDQNGMNTAFRVLELDYRFDRDQRGGGPRITDLNVWRAAHAA